MAECIASFAPTDQIDALKRAGHLHHASTLWKHFAFSAGLLDIPLRDMVPGVSKGSAMVLTRLYLINPSIVTAHLKDALDLPQLAETFISSLSANDATTLPHLWRVIHFVCLNIHAYLAPTTPCAFTHMDEAAFEAVTDIELGLKLLQREKKSKETAFLLRMILLDVKAPTFQSPKLQQLAQCIKVVMGCILGAHGQAYRAGLPSDLDKLLPYAPANVTETLLMFSTATYHVTHAH